MATGDIVLDGLTFNARKHDANTNPYGLGGGGHKVDVTDPHDSEILPLFMLLFKAASRHSADTFNNTSSTEHTIISTGDLTFTVDAVRPYVAGAFIIVI